MAGLKLNFPKLPNSSETAYTSPPSPPQHSSLEGELGANRVKLQTELYRAYREQQWEEAIKQKLGLQAA